MTYMTLETFVVIASIFCFAAMGALFYSRWVRFLVDDHNHQRALAAEQVEALRKEQERSRMEMLHLTQTILRRSESKEQRDGNEAGLNSGGYIFFEMPDAKKGIFQDLLRGFEDYAKLRGYIIHFSLDNSFANKVAFKFTLDSTGVNVSTGQVRRDLREYIEKVQRGDSLDDLPVVLTPEEHGLVLACLKNRISLLEHNYNLEKTAKEFYAGLLNKLPSLGFGVGNPQNFYMQAGPSNQASSYLAQNSPQAALGMGHRIMGNSLDQSIYIANSFNELKQQISAVTQLERALASEMARRNPEGDALAQAQEAEKCLRKAREELEDEKEPDPKRVLTWLEQAKYALKAFGLTKEIIDAGQKLEEAFHISDWIGPLIP